MRASSISMRRASPACAMVDGRRDAGSHARPDAPGDARPGARRRAPRAGPRRARARCRRRPRRRGGLEGEHVGRLVAAAMARVEALHRASVVEHHAVGAAGGAAPRGAPGVRHAARAAPARLRRPGRVGPAGAGPRLLPGSIAARCGLGAGLRVLSRVMRARALARQVVRALARRGLALVIGIHDARRPAGGAPRRACRSARRRCPARPPACRARRAGRSACRTAGRSG